MEALGRIHSYDDLLVLTITDYYIAYFFFLLPNMAGFSEMPPIYLVMGCFANDYAQQLFLKLSVTCF